MMSVTLPALFGVFDMYREDWKTTNRKLSLEQIAQVIMSVALGVLFVFGPFLFFYGVFDQVVQNVAGLHEETLWPSGEFRGYLEVAPLVLLTMAMPFIFALTIKPYRLGAALVLGSLAMVQIFYFAPVLGDYIKELTELILEVKG